MFDTCWSDVQKLLDDAGEKGWELVTVRQTSACRYELFFKRPKEDYHE